MSGGYGIQDVGRRCGVNPVTLRAWERRYGLIQPARTDSGHRRYSDADVARIRVILGWLERGLPIGQVRQVLTGSQVAWGLEDGVPDGVDGDISGLWREPLDEALAALEALNSRRLEQLFNRLTSEYPLSRVLARFCDPLLENLRSRPARAGARALLEATLRQKLAGRLLSLAPRHRQRGWLVMAVGDPLGAQMQALLLGPVWCLDQTVPWSGLSTLLDPARLHGVLWVVGERPTRRDAIPLWPRHADAGLPLAAAGPALTPAVATPPGVARVAGNREDVAIALQDTTFNSESGGSSATGLVS